MQLLSKISRILNNKPSEQPSEQANAIESSQNRALVWLGKDQLDRQYFYERWAGLESWYIYKQGIPLILGRDPDDSELNSDTEFVKQRNELWEHIKRCVERKVSPFLLNPAEKDVNWQAEPVELYRWAIAARLSVPEELDALMAFISSTVKPFQLTDDSYSKDSGLREEQTAKYIAREQALSVMLALTLQKLSQEGNIDISELRRETIDYIQSRPKTLFNQDQPPLSRPVLNDLFDRSLETSGVIRV